MTADPDPWTAALEEELGGPLPTRDPAPSPAPEPATPEPRAPEPRSPKRRSPKRRSPEHRSQKPKPPKPEPAPPAEQPPVQLPAVLVPPELPIADRADELIAAIRDHQVVVVAGETGSGKSTQLPKLCLAAGRGTRGLVGHTQPRRLAARAVAERVAEELGGTVGGLVGYQVRFTDETAPSTRIKLMTDGILLNELQRDRDLRRYDTIIIDEAHERGLNIDFILGYLAQLLPRRPDLSVVITSATIDTQRFADHFSAALGVEVPVFEVSGRTYPVEVRYRPLEEEAEDGRTVERDVTDGIVDAVAELVAEGPGDVLVFAAGERDIRDAAEALVGAAKRDRALAGIEVLPLYARLSAAEQHRVFEPHRGRRVVIATNIAETSLTVPGIRSVVDPGLARISRYNRRTKVQRLPIEEISRASADQRSGRCGRVAPGIAIRLYDEEGFLDRPEFTEPEIVRTNLASVILQMTALGLGDIAAFPFVDRPDDRAVADGIAVLEELGALVDDPAAPGGRALTPLGRRLARIPLDPRLARMVLAAEDEGCVHEVMVIASFLSIQDPRERPQERRQQAEELHARFAEPGSDFLTVLNLWEWLHETRRSMTGGAFRRKVREEFLHFLRIREWQDVYSQLRRVVKDLGVPLSRYGDAQVPPPAAAGSQGGPGGGRRRGGRRPPPDARADAIHRAMLAGLLSNIGLRDGEKREYRGTRDTRFVIGRESVLAQAPPTWVVAAELVETARLFTGMAAGIRPQWVEPLAGDLAVRSHGEGEWSPSRGAATVIERVTFRGLPIVAGRRIPLSRIDPAAARRLFITSALVEGDSDLDEPFMARNAAQVEAVRELEDRLRRRIPLDPADVLAEAYEQRIPADVTSVADFRRWWRDAQRERPHLLDVDLEALVAEEVPDLARGPGHAYPEALPVGGVELPLRYAFEPDDPEVDGVTVDVPVEVLPTLEPGAFDWLVPGMRHELVVSLIRALPKPLRRGLVPVPDTARRVLERISPADGPLLPVLARELTRLGGVPVTVDAWRGAALPPHLRIRYRVVQGDRELAAGTDLGALKRGVAAHVRAAVAEAAPAPAHTGLTAWTFGPLQRQVVVRRDGIEVTSYPALVDEGATVGVATFPTAAEQQAAMWAGTRRLLRLALPNPVRTLDGQLDRAAKLALTQAPHRDVTAVVEDCLACVLDAIVADHGGPVWDPQAFEALRADVRERSPRLLGITTRVVADLVTQSQAVKDRLRQPAPPALDPGRRDVGRQLGRLIFPGFVVATGGDRLGHLRRYLQGMLVRLDAMGRNPDRDAELQALVTDLEEEHALLRDLRPERRGALRRVRWQLEELRISVFAQQLGTAEKVSEARIRDALAAIRSGA